MIHIKIEHPLLSAHRTFSNESEVDNVKTAIAWLAEMGIPAAHLAEPIADSFRQKGSGLQVVGSSAIPADELHFIGASGKKTVYKTEQEKR